MSKELKKHPVYKLETEGIDFSDFRVFDSVSLVFKTQSGMCLLAFILVSLLISYSDSG